MVVNTTAGKRVKISETRESNHAHVASLILEKVSNIYVLLKISAFSVKVVRFA